MNLLTFLAVGVIGFVAYDVWKKSKMPTRAKAETKKEEEEDDTSFMSSGLFDSDCPKLANNCPMNKS
jgi:uncharacterized membrane protein YebE (DUF533 family)